MNSLTLICAGAVFVALASDAHPFENASVAMTFDRSGALASLREKASGRELVGRRLPLAEGTLASPLPTLSAGLTRIPVTAERAEGARVTFWKHDLANGEGK